MKALLPYRRLAVLLAIVLLLALLLHGSGWRAHLNVNALQAQLHQNPWRGLGLFVLLFAVGNLLHLPGSIFLAAAVLAFGRVEGGLLTYVAACLSCAFTFATVRLLGGNMAVHLRQPLALRLLAQLHAHPVRNMVLLRMVFQTLPSLNYALALSGLRLRHYLLGTLLGLPLPIAVYCVFFDYLITALHPV